MGVQVELAKVSYGSIEALPEHHSVVKGTTATYRLKLELEEPDFSYIWDRGEVSGKSKMQEQFDATGRTRQMINPDVFDEHDDRGDARDIASSLAWYVIYDYEPGEGGPPYELVGRNSHEVEIKWKRPGQHVVLCQIGYDFADARAALNDLANTHILFTQRVAELNTVQRRRMRKQKSGDLPNPFEEMDALEKYLDACRAVEREKGCPRDKQEEYEKELRQREKYLEHLYKLVDPLDRRRTFPVPASYVAQNKAQQVDLRIAIQETMHIGMDDDSSFEIWLVDWTNPLDNRLRGQYWAQAKTREEAIDRVVSEWRGNSAYYHPGNVVVEFPEFFNMGDQPKPVRREFNTPGKGFWGKLQEFLEAIAMALAVATAVVAMVVPIPGSRVVSGLIWASIFTSSAGSAISIGRRKRNGFADWQDDAFDVLTIVGNVFTAGRMAWARRAMLTSRTFAGQFKRFCLYGEVGTDYLQGILIAREKMDEFENILDDPSLSPSERVNKMLEFVRSATISQAISYASVRGSKRGGGGGGGGKRPDTFIDPPLRKQLDDPNAEVNLDTLRKQNGDASQGGVKTKVQDEHKPARGKKRKKARREKTRRNRYRFDPAPSPEKRGVRPDDDFDFAQQARNSDRIVLVRDSNEAMLRHVGDASKGPKRLDLKAKSLPTTPPPKLRNPDHAGLAAAHPDDPRLQAILADSKSPKTGKPPMRHAEYLDELRAKGYEVRGPDGDYVVYSDKHKGGYYSDYDLHGVYDKKGRDAYSESFRDELNARFGKELVQHGPHDKWPDRNKKSAGPNRGPQPPVTAYVPRGKKVERFHLKTIDDMREFYEAWNIPWDRIYPPR